jgi:hypothetical protein
VEEFLKKPFKTSEEEASAPFELIPRDRYKAEIVSAKAGTTKNGKGYKVVLNWSIVEGDYENRTIFQDILLEHESPDAARIGRQKFKDVCIALGHKEDVEDLSVLYHRPCLIFVAIRSDKDGQYPDQNEVKRVAPIPPSHNGPTRAMIKEAQKTPPAFKAGSSDLNDEIPPF